MFMKQQTNKRLTAKDIAVIGVMTATLEAAKTALSFLPNVELVTLLIILYTLFLGRKAILAVLAFVGIECMIWGFGLWTVMYFYIWPLLSLLTYFLRKQTSVFVFAILSALFGLFFGALCAIPYFFIGGPSMAITWWISGIPYDILHCVSNFVLCMVLFVPLRAILNKIKYAIYQ